MLTGADPGLASGMRVTAYAFLGAESAAFLPLELSSSPLRWQHTKRGIQNLYIQPRALA